MQELLHIIRRLRGPGGCPWDKEQTHLSLRPYLLEEAAEAVDAMTQGDMHELQGELGDVLLQVAFHSVLAQETGDFSYEDVERTVIDKLVRRHPHVFGTISVNSAQVNSAEVNITQVKSNWQASKEAERAGQPPRTLSQQIPTSLGALAREQRYQELTPQLTQTGQQRGAANLPMTPQQPTPQQLTPQQLAEQLSALVQRAAHAGLNAEQVLREHTNARIHAQEGQHV